MDDIVRVIRIVEMVGPRGLIEKQLSHSLHGTKDFGNGVRISSATIGEFPEILAKALEAEADEAEAANG